MTDTNAALDQFASPDDRFVDRSNVNPFGRAPVTDAGKASTVDVPIAPDNSNVDGSN